MSRLFNSLGKKMNTFKQLKLGIVTLASIGMIAACGGGSSSGSSSSIAGATAPAEALAAYPDSVNKALGIRLTDEISERLASGASVLASPSEEASENVYADVFNIDNFAWAIVSDDSDFWHDTVYVSESGELSRDDKTGTAYTLMMYGFGPNMDDDDYDIMSNMHFAYIDINTNEVLVRVHNIYLGNYSLQHSSKTTFGVVISEDVDSIELFPTLGALKAKATTNGSTISLEFVSEYPYLGYEYDVTTAEDAQPLMYAPSLVDRLLYSLVRTVEASEEITYSQYSYWNDDETGIEVTNLKAYIEEQVGYQRQQFVDELAMTVNAANGVLALGDLDLSKACLLRVIDVVPFDEEIPDYGDAPMYDGTTLGEEEIDYDMSFDGSDFMAMYMGNPSVTVLDISKNTSLDKQALDEAITKLASKRELGKAQMLKFIDIRGTGVNEEDVAALIDNHSDFLAKDNVDELLGKVILVHDGNADEYENIEGSISGAGKFW